MHILAKICREWTRKSLLSTTKIDVLAALPTTFTCYLIFFKPLVSPKLIVSTVISAYTLQLHLYWKAQHCYTILKNILVSWKRNNWFLGSLSKNPKLGQSPACDSLKNRPWGYRGELRLECFQLDDLYSNSGWKIEVKKIHLSHVCWIQDLQFLPLNTYWQH